jgi:branched-chain amino acid transport system substrate-binding protein
MQYFRLRCMALAGACWLTLLDPAVTLAEDYQLGVILGLTGAGAVWSNEGAEAIRLAVDEINSEGGLLKKYPIKLTIVDDQAKPDVSRQIAKVLVSKTKARCVIGTWSSSCALAIKPIFAEAKVLHIDSISNSEDITRLNPSPYTFSVVPNTYMLAKAQTLGTVRLANANGWKSYATITSDYAFGRSIQGNTVSMLKVAAPDLILKKDVWVPLGETQWAPHFAALAAAKPDFINVTLTADDNRRFVEIGSPLGFFLRYPCPGIMLSVSELQDQKDKLPRGLLAVTRAPFFAHLDEPAMQSLVAKWRKTHSGRYPTDWHVLNYDAVMVLKQGVEKAGSIETEDVRAALEGATVQTCRGKLPFRKIDNQLICPVYIGSVEDDPEYSFPIYHDLQVFAGNQIMRPEAEIIAARVGD